MVVRIFVTLKPSVLDPQGMTIQKALATLGHGAAAEVRQGKYFEIRWDGDLALESERAKVQSIASSVLSNPVIESYRIEWPSASASGKVA